MSDAGRRNPFDGVLDYFSELARMREIGTHGREQSHSSTERTHASAWVPSTDIFARDSDLVIRVEVAGVETQDVDINFDHGVLTISGVRHTGLSESGAGAEVEYYVQERFQGEFRRVINLPDAVEPSQITARLEDGLVEVVVVGAANRRESTRIKLVDQGSAAEVRRLD